jgi:hypothetical protein
MKAARDKAAKKRGADYSGNCSSFDQLSAAIRITHQNDAQPNNQAP